MISNFLISMTFKNLFFLLNDDEIFFKLANKNIFFLLSNKIKQLGKGE